MRPVRPRPAPPAAGGPAADLLTAPDLEALYARHRDELFRFAARFTGDADLAEDVVQDVFVRLAERPPRHDASLRGWLFRAATTVALDHLRGARRRRNLVSARPADVPMAAAAPDPMAAAEQADLRRKVRAALAELKDRDRAVLLMSEEGFTHREIADAVGTTTKSVGTMIARALAKLALRLDLDAEDVT